MTQVPATEIGKAQIAAACLAHVVLMEDVSCNALELGLRLKRIDVLYLEMRHRYQVAGSPHDLCLGSQNWI